MVRIIIGDIRKHLEVTPFIPFRIRIAEGHEYLVPTVDHIYLPPGSARVVVADDEGIATVLPALLITGLVHSANGSSKRELGA